MPSVPVARWREALSSRQAGLCSTARPERVTPSSHLRPFRCPNLQLPTSSICSVAPRPLSFNRESPRHTARVSIAVVPTEPMPGIPRCARLFGRMASNRASDAVRIGHCRVAAFPLVATGPRSVQALRPEPRVDGRRRRGAGSHRDRGRPSTRPRPGTRPPAPPSSLPRSRSSSSRAPTASERRASW